MEFVKANEVTSADDKYIVKVDRNGTKYYEKPVNCYKCHGTGSIGAFGHIYNGVCFDCNGSGKIISKFKVMTPEYEKVFNKRREDKRARELEARKAEADKLNKELYNRLGFADDGTFYVVLGNTYEIKDHLKNDLGAKFNGFLNKWVLPNKPTDDSLHTYKMNAKDIFGHDEAGVYFGGSAENCDEFLDKMEEEDKRVKNAVYANSGYVGNVGDKITVKVESCKLAATYDTQFGSVHVYQFEDANHNVFIWKTSSYVDDNFEIETITGTIKEQKEYRGIKQNILTRCRFNK